jgi:hypothetical protein
MPPKRKGPARKRTAKKGTTRASKKTSDFLIALSKSPKLKAAWKKDPVGTMRKAGLSEEAIKALKSGNSDKVAQHLGDDAPPGCFICIIIA